MMTTEKRRAWGTKADDFMARYWGQIILACMGALLFWMFMESYRTHKIDKLPHTTTDTYVGKVIQVSGCSSHKYSLDCWVRFDHGQLIYTDVADWPGSNVQVGQEVWWRVIQHGDVRQKFYYVVKGQNYMRYMGSCKKDYDPPCWRN